jgi:hypothetical protein
VLATILLVAAAALVVTPFAARPLLRWAVQGVDAVAVGSVVGSFFAALALFAIPVTLSGLLRRSSYGSRSRGVEEAGRVGRLYALSTAGSLCGTFVAALVAIPFAGRSGRSSEPASVSRWGAAARRRDLGCSPRRRAALLAAAHARGSSARSTRRSPSTSTSGSSRTARRPRPGAERRASSRTRVAPDTVLTGGYWDLFLMLPPLCASRRRTCS